MRERITPFPQKVSIYADFGLAEISVKQSLEARAVSEAILMRKHDTVSPCVSDQFLPGLDGIRDRLQFDLLRIDAV